ncbi:exodeoxyribonuclease VII small subunit [Patescibacteria group bacterium]|nr:exodeoxyribonuclease VII small subunit [Patescibacteria group bacterium]
MATKKESQDIDMQQGFKELEEIAAWFENQEVDVDQGIEKFERAMVLADVLKKRLSLAENKVKEIKKKYNAE